MSENDKHFLADFAFINDTASSLAASFRSKERSIKDYYIKLFEYIEKTDASLNSLTSVQKAYALEKAEELDKRKANDEEVLFGVPFVIKENMQKKGFPVQCASKILAGYKGQFDATAIELLEKAGAIPIATANMDEFAMGSSNEHSCHGPVRNPHNFQHVSGGSSGGSAASCTVGYAPFTLGSDTGGSVRLPAAFCGIFGMKPTYGRVSRNGLVAYGSSLDQISPFTRSAADLDLIFKIIGHQDPRDSTTLIAPYHSFEDFVSLKGIKIGVPRGLLAKGIDPAILQAFHEMEKNLEKEGCDIIDIDIKGLEHTLAVYYVLACAEASSNLARFDGVRFGKRSDNADDLMDLYCKTRSEGFGEEVKLRIMLGTFTLSAGYYDSFYGKAQGVRNMMRKEFSDKFKNVDFILMPTSPNFAFRLNENMQDPLQMYLNDVFTIPANLTGLPAISVPLANESQLPMGVQFFGPHQHDSKLIALAKYLEKQGLVRVKKFSSH